MTVTIEEAMCVLSELIEKIGNGEEVIITHNQKPVASLVVPKLTEQPMQPRIPGLMKGKLVIVAEDDEHLKDFAEYM